MFRYSALFGTLLAVAGFLSLHSPSTACDQRLTRPAWVILQVSPAPAQAQDRDYLGRVHVVKIQRKRERREGGAPLVELCAAELSVVEGKWLRISRKTAITVNGQPARFKALKTGMVVEFRGSVQTKSEPPTLHATEVHAWSGPQGRPGRDDAPLLIELE